MIPPEQIDTLRQRTADPDGIPTLLRSLEEIQKLEPEQEGEELDDIRLSTFHALVRLTKSQPTEVAPIIIRHLLPLSLRANMEWGVPHVGHRYDELLSEWLDNMQPAQRFPIRTELIDALLAALSGATARRACRLLARLGYRDQRAADCLLSLASTGQDEVPDVAIHVLSALGTPPPLYAAVVLLWIERVNAVPCNHDLIGAAKQLASGEMLEPVFQHWLAPEVLQEPDANSNLLLHLAMGVPATIAERSPDNAELQDRTWDRVQALRAIAPQLCFHRMLGSSQVAHPCDSPGVVSFYLSILQEEERVRDLAYFRLEECDRPRQLRGWEEDPGQDTLQAVLHDAAAPTGMVGSYMTQELRRKQHAWQTLLSLGRSEALALVEAAVTGEENGHAIGEILDLAACFRLNPIPPRVGALLAGEFGNIAEVDSERLSSHIAAIAVARASESRTAFEALMAFNLIRPGGVLISLLDAITDAAASLIQAGDVRTTERLWEATEAAQPGHRRAAAAAAIGKLLRRGLLRPLQVDRISALVEDDTLDRYARRLLLDSIGHLPHGEATPQSIQLLWAKLHDSPRASGNVVSPGADFRPVALAALARLGFLSPDSDALRQYLGLRLVGSDWRCDHSQLLAGIPGVLGILFAQEPGRYALAVADLLRGGNWSAVVQLAPYLRSAPRPTPEPIIAALLERARRAGPEVGEPDLLPLIADVAPDRIGNESWSGMTFWLPQVRAALAEALRRSPSPDSIDRRANLLLLLMGDSQLGVRRAAFRALAAIHPDRFRAICTSWALLTEANVQAHERPYAIDMRRRAAEAAAWLVPASTDEPIAALAADPEPDVRATFARCQRERREREWASDYLRHVLSVRDDASLLGAWKYGRALERIGDDEALDRLEEQRRQDLPPGVRHWLGRLIKRLRVRWDEITRSWPEPWFARRGRLERVDALVGDDEVVAEQVSCWLWQVPATDLTDLSVWGGWCDDASLPTEKLTLRIRDRHPATILVTQSTMASWGTGPAYFKGSGPYPELVEGGH